MATKPPTSSYTFFINQSTICVVAYLAGIPIHSYLSGLNSHMFMVSPAINDYSHQSTRAFVWIGWNTPLAIQPSWASDRAHLDLAFGPVTRRHYRNPVDYWPHFQIWHDASWKQCKYMTAAILLWIIVNTYIYIYIFIYISIHKYIYI